MVELKKDNAGADLAVASRVAIDAANKIITITPDGDLAAGSYTVKVLANTVEDVADNAVVAASATFTVDAAAPTVTFVPADGDVVTDVDTDVLVQFDEPVRQANNDPLDAAAAAAAVELKKVNGDGTDLAGTGQVRINNDKTVITMDPANPLETGSQYTVTLRASTVEDAHGNEIGSARTSTFTVGTVDTAAPTLTLTGVPAYINDTDAFTVTLTFNEAVTGFIIDDVSVSNARLSGWATTTPGLVFNVAVTPDGSGDVTITVQVNSAEDLAGNPGPAAAVNRTAVWDATPPEVSIGIKPETFDNANPDVTVEFTFTEVVTGFDLSDVTVTGGSKPAALISSQGGKVYRGVFTPTGDSGDLAVEVEQGAATDRAGNRGPTSVVRSRARRNVPEVPPLAAPGIDNFRAEENEDGSFTLRWALSGGEVYQQTVTGGELGEDIGEEVDPGTSELRVHPTEETTYTLTVGNIVNDDVRFDTAKVTVLAAAPVVVKPVEPVNSAPSRVVVDWVVPALDGVIAEDVDAGAGRVKLAELSAIDADAGDRHRFALSGTAALEVDGTVLYLKQGTALDYETAASYRFSITATDSGGLSVTRAGLTLTLTNVNEGPTGVVVDWVVPAEDGVMAEDVDVSAGRVQVAELSAIDVDVGDHHAFSVSAGVTFETDGAALYLKQGAALDYETAASYRFRITTTDSGGLSFTGAEQTLTLTDVNEGPTGVVVDWVAPALDGVMAEDVDTRAGRVKVADLSAIDVDVGDRHVFSVSAGVTFETDGAALYLKQGAALDYETAASYRFRITTTDSGGLSFTGAEQTLTLTDVNEGPTGVVVDWVAPAADGVMAEDVDTRAGRVQVAELSAIDVDVGDHHVFSVSAGVTFETDGAALYLKQGAAFDYETRTSYRFRITTTDSGGLSFTGAEQTLTLTDVNEGPTGVVVDWVAPALDGVMAEDVDTRAGRVKVAELSAIDVDVGDHHVFSVSAGVTFETDGAALYLKQGAAFDYETRTSYRFRITTTDSGGLSFTGAEQTLTLTDVNEGPTGVVVDWVAPAADGVMAEDVDTRAGRVQVAELSAIDVDVGDHHVFSVSAGVTFETDGAALYLKQGAAFDYETRTSYRFRITTTDSGGLSFTGAEQTLTLTDVNEGPTGVVVDWVAPAADGVMAEDVDTRAGRVQVAELSAIDVDVGDHHVFSVSAGVTFETDAGVLYLRQGAALDYETRMSYRFRITTTDSGGLSFTGAEQTLTLTDVNEAPAFEQGHYAFELAENRLGPVALGAVRATDQDAGDTLTYALSRGAGGLFAIDAVSGIITYTGAGEDHESEANRYALRVRATDSGGLDAGAEVTVTVMDEEQAVARARLSRVNAALLPAFSRALVAGVVEDVARRIKDANPHTSVRREGDAVADHLLAIVQTLKANEESLNAGNMDWKQVLAGSSFLFRLGDKAGEAGARGDGAPPAPSSGGVTLWGEGDWRVLSVDGEAAPVEFGGDVMAARVGVDGTWRDDLLTGVTLAWSRGSFDWTDSGLPDRPAGADKAGAGADKAGAGSRAAAGRAPEYRALAGRHTTRMTSLHPYVGWWPGESLGLWGTVGYGRGAVGVDDEEAGWQSSDAVLRSAALGARVALFSGDAAGDGGTTSLALKSEAWLAHFEVADNGDRIAGLTVNSHRLRLSLEGEQAYRLASGATLTPALELGLRHDGGDGETGHGVEVGAGLRWADPARGLTGEVHGRVLLAHQSALEEWGVGGQVTLDPGADGQGLSFSLRPSWGAVDSGLERLWADGTAGVNDNRMSTPTRFDAEVGYGLGAVAGRGVLTPYGGLALSGGGERRYRLGTRLEVGPSFSVDLEGTRREGTAGGDHGIMLQSTANW